MLGKLEKKRRYLESPYALYGENVPKPGTWRSSMGVPPETPLILEIGCGKGEFAVYMAQRYPESLVIGLDRRADRLYAGCRSASQLALPNVRFWHGDALTLEAHFAPAEVSIIWLNYPDPYPKKRHEKHRLLHPKFLRIYRIILSPGGALFFRTDDEALYLYSLEQLSQSHWQIVQATSDLQPEEADPAAYVETEFQRRKGGRIHYIHAIPS
ncbi:MAG: tRNA (guanosine(46)-N7)-methyltransferase TrmB [Bacteroidia bacterium]|nr:tRNA (guanosine(46)-N7)-methyltransferase TrmB [Bacteroidia bacterium]